MTLATHFREVVTKRETARSPLPLQLAIGEYDRTRPLINGTVRPEGIVLSTANPHVAEFCSVPVYEQYDLAEMSFSLFVAAKARGQKVVGLPIFPLRMAVLAYAYCRDDSPYTKPSDLIGKRVATLGYRYTVNIWLRGIFKEHYGLSPEQVTWITPAHESAGFQIPKGIDVRVKEGRTEAELLLSGEADAIISPSPPPEILGAGKRIRRLFPDAQAEGLSYFRKTGIFPATHIVVMRESSYRANPWAAEPIVKAFAEAQRQTDAFIYADARHNVMPDSVFYIEEQRRLWGDDPWTHGVSANRPMVETFTRYACEQGYTDRVLTIEEMFAENTLHL